MKELSIEEKAQRYDEALTKARNIVNSINVGLIGKDSFEAVFPELAESEDERIRKAMIKYFTNGKEYLSLTPYSREDYIAWLEKQGEKEEFIKKELECIRGYRDEAIRRLHELEQQGEPKLAGKVEPKFHEGDIIIHKELGGDYIHNPHKIIQVDILDKKYRLEGGLVVHFSEQDDYELVEQKSAEWSDTDYVMQRAALEILMASPKTVAFTILKESVIVWFNSLKDRVQPQNLSITDEELAQAKKEAYNDALDKIEYHSGEPTFDDGWDAAIWYLKKRNVQPQSYWKPDSSMLICLEYAIKHINKDGDKRILSKLLEQLKKL